MERQITLGDVIAPAKVLRCDNDDYSVLSMTMHDGIVLQSNRFKKSLVSIDQSNYKVVLRGQLVVGFPIDEGVIYVQNIAEAGIMSPAYGVWNIHSKEILPEYLELCLHSPQSMDYYKNKLRGTTARRRSITTGDLLALPIILPSLTEQKRRIGLFRQTTLLLNSQKQTMLKFDELVKSRFVEMFGGIHDSVLYPYMTVDSFTKVTSGGTPDRNTPSYWENGKIRWVKTTELQNCVICDTEEKITDEGVENSSAKMVPANTILIAMYGQGKTRGMTGYLAIEGATNQACACILPSEEINQRYLWQYMILSYDKLRSMAKGGNQPNLNAGIIKSFPVLVPPLELQNRFASFVSEVDKSKLAVKQSLEKLETLKKSLMQQYFG